MKRASGARVLVIAALTLIPLAALYGWGRDRAPFEILEGAILDWRFALRGPISPGGDVVIVTIDDRSIEKLGGWPLPRRVLAEMAERLNAADAEVIAFDLLLLDFEQPTIAGAPGTGDQRLIEAVGNARAAILPFAFDFQTPPTSAQDQPDVVKSALPVQHWRGSEATLPQPMALAAPPAPLLANAWTAHTTVAVEADGTLRAVELVLPFAGRIYPALPLQAVRLFRHVP